MQMQTGPKPGQSIAGWLAWTATGELTSVAVFIALTLILTNGRAGPWPFAWLGLATLSLILLQGSLYWLDKRRTLGRPRSASTRVAVLRTMYIATAVLLTIFPVSILLAALTAPILFRPGDLLFGAAWYLFAVGEAVHYFVFKINMRPREWRQALQQRRPIAARLRRELRRAQLELSREEARD